MSFITVDRTQKSVVGYSIEDFAKTDTKGRFVVETISSLNLGSLFTRYSSQGGDSFAPDMMLALWFYAYSNGITSTRKLEELCMYDTRYIYISCNLQPDHTTLSRFRQSHLDLISEYFVQIVLLAQEQGVTDLKHISIDGTKIKASANAKHSYKEDRLKSKIEAIRRDIKQYMAACEGAEQGLNETLDLESLQAEKKRLEALEKKLIRHQKKLQERKKTLKPEHREKHQINIVDPDARFMPKADGPSYNAQAAVDDAHNFILANDVIDDPNDQNQFSPMHQKVEENLPPDSNRGYTADSGYHSLKQLQYIKENNIDALIADPTPGNRSTNKKLPSIESILKQERKVERKDFSYHAQDDYYECPVGNKLTASGKNAKFTRYRACACSTCPIAKFCLPGKSKVKQIFRDHREGLAEEMEHKLQTDKAKKRMKTRATSVEPVFGNIKQNLGFRRFSLRGLAQVKGEFNLICIAHNLNILFKLMQPQRLTVAMAASSVALNQYIAISKNIMAIFLNTLVNLLIFPYRMKYRIVQL